MIIADLASALPALHAHGAMVTVFGLPWIVAPTANPICSSGILRRCAGYAALAYSTACLSSCVGASLRRTRCENEHRGPAALLRMSVRWRIGML
jgi:hypothetical protein